MDLQTIIPATLTFLAGTPLTEVYKLLTKEAYEWTKKLFFKKDETIKEKDWAEESVINDLENNPNHQAFLDEITALVQKDIDSKGQTIEQYIQVIMQGDGFMAKNMIVKK